MIFAIPSNKMPFTIIVGVRTKKSADITITAKDYHKKDSYYISRAGTVDGYREFELKFPQTPRVMTISVFNEKNGNYKGGEDKSFIITKFEVKKLKTCPLWSNTDLASFIKFAQEFSANASIISAGDFKPSIYRSDDGKFCIDYYNKIRDRKTKEFVGTPARIGHNSGIIEVSKSSFLQYTIPIRMVVLLHEFSHKWMNPITNKEISDETAADINALNIYLSLGYPSIEAQYAFLKIFRVANNEFNHKRYVILDDFIKKFTEGQLENQCVVDYSKP